ncbi:disulfide bond formation protein B [Agrilutibacter solisilvae]|uniref:Disulfide bond formation protein B n=1 Tax=Agrilutibacter solisilvae TaxID=2763317 RepID=A0A974Y6Q8_9GAMM|nr:disulfide bond formation protein B [Lysobacter solisilvae]QSX79876.1 disulfide bond formation protein B [Lysobacter solisilvae]
MNPNPLAWSFRAQCALGLATCAALLGFAFYTQFRDVNPLDPCNLCILQRVAFAATALAFLLGALHAPGGAAGRRVYAGLALLASAVGAAIAARHVWITTLPEDARPSCGAPLEFMVQASGYLDAVRKVLTGSGECGKVDWTFLGLSMPAWSLVWFVALLLWAGYVGFRRR